MAETRSQSPASRLPWYFRWPVALAWLVVAVGVLVVEGFTEGPTHEALFGARYALLIINVVATYLVVQDRRNKGFGAWGWGIATLLLSPIAYVFYVSDVHSRAAGVPSATARH